MTDIDGFILLNAVTGIGSVRLKALLDCFKGPRDILGASKRELLMVPGIASPIADGIVSVRDKFDIARERRLIKENGIHLITLYDQRYPELLKQTSSAPILLYVKGRLKKADKNSIAVVGSRHASVHGLNNARRIAMELAGFGITVTSGFARGIDTAAHKGALEAKGRTLAVLGSGLSDIYPPEHRRIVERVASSGAVISEFPMETPPLSENFPRRNRVISGLSLGVVVVEAARRSGSLITAGFALDEGREVFAVPGRPGEITSAGTNRLIKQGAKLVESADDIIEELVGRIEGGDYGLKAPEEKERLSEEERKVCDILSDEPMHIDELSNRMGIPGGKVLGLLLKMESKGMVEELPGKLFSSRPFGA